MRKLLPLCIIMTSLLLAPIDAFAKKKSKKYDKQEVVTTQTAPVKETPHEVAITNAAHQLYGEWTLTTMRKKAVVTRDRAYLYLDFNNNKVYGSNGCNSINGSFTLNGNSLSFGEFITTLQSCHSGTSERTIMRTLAEVKAYKLTQLYNIEYLDLYNAKGSLLMTLKRQNLDFLNGAWKVKELYGRNVNDKGMRLVIDTNMFTIMASTECNLINGIITVDATKDFAIQFEDLVSAHNECPSIDNERDMLLALEETESCKRINDLEIALLDKSGTIVLRLIQIDLKKERSEKIASETDN